MTTVLLATDSEDVFSAVDSALASSNTSVLRVRTGQNVVPAVKDQDPDLVILDLQIGNMGGVAACLALRQEEGFHRLSHRPVGLLLDRQADVFLAHEADAEGWLVKPLDSLRLQRLANTLIKKQTLYEGIAG